MTRSILSAVSVPSVCFGWLWVFFVLVDTVRKLFVPVVALAKSVGAEKVCSLISNKDREDVVDHFTQTPKAVKETKKT